MSLLAKRSTTAGPKHTKNMLITCLPVRRQSLPVTPQRLVLIGSDLGS